MKILTNSKLAILFLLSILIFCVDSLHAQGSCSFSIKTQVTPVDCRANGVIKITLEGSDLASMQDFLYRAYPSAANPNDYEFIRDSIISGLVEGNYIVEVKAFCTLSGVNISQFQTNVNVPRTVAYIEPDFSLNPVQFRKSLPCLPTGTLYMQGIVKGKGPYTIKLKKYPTTYTGDTIIYQGASLGATYTINNLSAGTYDVELSDGCGSTIQQTGVVESISDPFYSSFISYFYGVSANISENGCSTITFSKSNPSSTHELYYYTVNSSLFYEYAVYYTGDNLDDMDWKPVSTSSNTISTRYNVSEMRADTAKVPKIYVRVKGGDGCGLKRYNPSLYPSYVSTSYSTIDCGTRRYTYIHNSSAVLCYPYTFTVRDVSTTDSTIVSVSAPKYYNSVRDTLDVSPGDKYTITLTDASGFTYSFNLTGTAASNTIYSSSTTSGCNLYYPYIYSSLAGATIEFLRDQTDARVPTPKHSNVTLPKTYTGYYFYPYSDDYTRSQYFPSDSIIPTGLYAYFKVTDSCGISKTISFYGPSLKQYVAEPIFDITQSCGRATIKISNLAQILKNVNSITGAQSNLTAYAQIVSRPTGSDIIYSSIYSYLRSNYSDSVQVNKSGTYRFAFSNTSGFSGTSYCLKYVDVVVDIPEMAIDDATTAAYRCPGSSVGTGYMNIKVKNGSGNYKFTLYSQDDLSTELATSTDGVFTSWLSASSDYYTVKIEDLTCGRSMTHNVFVYDLGNATLGWPEDNIFRKCLGDRIKLYALALGETSYTWYGPAGWSSTERDPEIPVAELKHSGKYRVVVGVPGCGAGATVEYEFSLSIADKVMYWNPDAVDGNWYNTANWLTSTSDPAISVPAPCTTVHIAGNSTKYPNLSMTSTPRNVYGFPACDTIIFHYGAETVYPHFLKYNRARVQYNMNYYKNYALDTQPAQSKDMNEYPDAYYGENMPVMKRAQWYTISAPLKNITGGDFGLGGYPNIYQRRYNAQDPQRGTTAKDSYTESYNTYNIGLESAGHALALWIADYDTQYLGFADHKHLEGLKGILEMPYFLNPQIMAHRPLNKYDVADSTSYFQYYDEKSPTLDPVDKWDAYKRGYKSYRFVFENDNDSVSIYNVNGQNVAAYRLELPIMSGSVSRRVMIGNPFMCHIDFDKLYALNNSVIEDHYMITDGATQLFLNYRVGGVQNELDKQIAPLQGFIVTLQENASSNYILLPLEGANAVITPSDDAEALNKPRSVSAPNVDNSMGWLNIEAVTPPIAGVAGTVDSVSSRSTLLINHSVFNIPKVVLPSGLEFKAEVYLIDQDGYLNTEQVGNQTSSIVKFGLESLYQKDITLKFSKDNGIIDEVILVDKHLGTTQDISNGGSYVFKHRYTYNNGLDNDRFELRLTYKSSSITNEDYAPVIIQATRSKFMVESADIIRSVNLHSTVGTSIIAKDHLQTTAFTEYTTLQPGVYVASVVLANNRVITQKIVVE